jgi:hypothetical protein
MGSTNASSYGREETGRVLMTRPERILALGGIGVIASAILLISYVSHSSADPQPSGCGADSERLDQSLDQLRFATSAQHALASALAYSDRSRATYYDEIKAIRTAPNDPASPQIHRDLVQASVILSDQEAPIGQAEAIAAQAGVELHSGAPLVAQASVDLRHGDCQALGLTIASSGWPKDHLLGQLASAARINSAVSDQLDDALALITQAKSLAR